MYWRPFFILLLKYTHNELLINKQKQDYNKILAK